MDIDRLRKEFPDETACRAFFERIIWRDGRFCPHCGGMKSWTITGKSARAGVHNNTAESFNSQLERAKQGVFHWLSKDHIQRYINEVVFRWNQRYAVEKVTKSGERKVVMESLPVIEQIGALLSTALGRQVRRTMNGGITAITA